MKRIITGVLLVITGMALGQAVSFNDLHAQPGRRVVKDARVDAAQKTPPYGVTFGGIVERVIDGDTIEIRPIQNLVAIRILDCWAPETRTRDQDEKILGFKAKKFMMDMAMGQPVKIHVPIKPGEPIGNSRSFSRTLAHVYLADGRSLAKEMVVAGHATKEKQIKPDE